MTSPPHQNDEHLLAMIPRLRAVRVAQGTCRLVAAVLGTIAGVLLLDIAFNLPPWARGLLLSCWLTGTGVLAWRWVLVPWRQVMTPAEVWSELQKRSRTLALPGNALPGSGDSRKTSPVLDTPVLKQSVPPAWNAALPARHILALLGIALFAVVASGIATVIVPGSDARLRRVFFPWSRTTTLTHYTVRVTSGDPVVRRGGSVTLTAYAERSGTSGTLPAEAELIVRELHSATEARVSMTAGTDAFHTTLPKVVRDLDYCVEVGGVRSDWHRVTVLDAVELTNGTNIIINQPVYTQLPPIIHTSLQNFECLQYSTIELQLKFSRPAAAATLEWKPDGNAASEIVSLKLDDDQLGAAGKTIIHQDGTFKLVLLTEIDGKRLRTETTVAVRAKPDLPPKFVEVAGLVSRPRTARNTDQLQIRFSARDDHAISTAVLEYDHGRDDSRPCEITIPIKNDGNRGRVIGELTVELKELFASSETLRFRIRVTDDRSLDQPKLHSQDALFPSTGWSELQLRADAPPLAEQDVTCQHEQVRETLSESNLKLRDAVKVVDKLRTDTAGRDTLEVDQSVRLHNTREVIRGQIATLTTLASDAELTPDLRAIAISIRSLCAEKLKEADRLLQQADTNDAAVRKSALDVAWTYLQNAHAMLNDLLLRNTNLAQVRNDRLKLLRLAEQVTTAATAENQTAEESITRNRELLARLDAIIAESEVLRLAAENAKAAELRRFATKTSAVFETLRSLDELARQTAIDARGKLVARLAQELTRHADAAAAFLKQHEIAARLARVALPRPEDFQKIAQLSAAGKTVEALAELEQQTQLIERLAVEFAKWADERSDPRAATRQLALWQTDLLTRYQLATKDVAFRDLPADVKADFQTEQQTLAAAIQQLQLPPVAECKATRDEAFSHCKLASEQLAGNAAKAADALKASITRLEQLAEKIPQVSDRLAKALREIDKLRPELETTSTAVELILKSNERLTTTELAKKLAPFVEKHQQYLATARALDLPGLDERKARLVTVLDHAIADLTQGVWCDVQVSQAWLKREIERLKSHLENSSPPDSKARELTARLATLDSTIEAHGDNLTPKLLEPAAPILQDAYRQLTNMQAQEAAVLLNEARLAVQHAELAVREAMPADARRRLRAALDAVRNLSDRLNGQESDLTRIYRLAAKRRVAAEKPKELLFSDEAARQLAREIDELTHTRVGAAGQQLKKRALENYSRLRTKPDPDRLGTELKSLVTTLEELAAKMADIGELARGIPQGIAAQPSPADKYLPSREKMLALRELTSRESSIRELVVRFNFTLAQQLKPAILPSSRRALVWQVLRLNALMSEVEQLHANLLASARTFSPVEPASQTLIESAEQITAASKYLQIAQTHLISGNSAEAVKFRAAGGLKIRSTINLLEKAAPQGKSSGTGDSLRVAQQELRTAMDYAARGALEKASQAMQRAANALTAAAESRGQ